MPGGVFAAIAQKQSNNFQHQRGEKVAMASSGKQNNLGTKVTKGRGSSNTPISNAEDSLATPQLRPLIVPDDTNTHLSLNQTTLNFLRKIPAPLHVVSITGRAKTGKSFFINRILQKQIFEVGVTYKPGTKGIWMWGPETIVRRKTNPKTKVTSFEKVPVIYLDTEGLGAPGNTADSYDPKLCALSVLLSSLLLYNVKSEIQIDDVNLLHSVAVLSSLFERTLPGESFPFPPMLWMVQQFQHELEGESPNTYLDWVLKEKPNLRNRKDIQLYNETVRVVKRFPTFDQNQRIVLMDHPAKGRTLPEISSLPWRELNARYRNQVNQMRNLIHEKVDPKTFNGFQVSGQFLADLLRDLVPELNSIDSPNVGPALIRQLSHTLKERLFEEYSSHMQVSISLPENISTLDDLHLQTKKRVIQTFRSNCTGSIEAFDNAKAFDELKERIDRDYSERLNKNTLLTKIASSQLIAEIFKDTTDKKYTSVEAFDSDIERLTEEYKQRAKGDPKLIAQVLESHRQKDIRLKKNLVLHENAHKDLGQMLAFLFTFFVVFYSLSLVFSISGNSRFSQMFGSLYMLCVIGFAFVLGTFHKFFDMMNVHLVEFDQLQHWFLGFKKMITLYGLLHPVLNLFFLLLKPIAPYHVMIIFLSFAVLIGWKITGIFTNKRRKQLAIHPKSLSMAKVKGKSNRKKHAGRQYMSAAGAMEKTSEWTQRNASHYDHANLPQQYTDFQSNSRRLHNRGHGYNTPRRQTMASPDPRRHQHGYYDEGSENDSDDCYAERTPDRNESWLRYPDECSDEENWEPQNFGRKNRSMRREQFHNAPKHRSHTFTSPSVMGTKSRPRARSAVQSPLMQRHMMNKPQKRSTSNKRGTRSSKYAHHGGDHGHYYGSSSGKNRYQQRVPMR